MGPMAGFSTQWQLTMDTICSITTFLIVFLLQRSQLKDSLAMQIKLSEIIAVLQGANNQLINIEELSEQQILELRKRYQHLASELQEEISTHQVLTSE